MGVYIPNWEKPKSCDECWAEYAYEICNSHSDCCPLVPVPPHGRLIDADDIDYPLMESEADEKWMHIAIDSAPTVIETEEGEA